MLLDVTTASTLDEHLAKTGDVDTTSTRYFMSQPDIRINIILMSLCWMTSSFNFNLIGFLFKYSPGSFFVNSSMSALSEVAAALVASLIYNKFGIRKAFVISFAISSLGGCGILWYKTHTDFYVRRPSIDSWTFPCLVIFAKFGISSALFATWTCGLHS
jgi:hypothetical protein